jgi:hypothetical protein
MKKAFLVSLIVVLLGALIVPAIVAPAPVAAWSGTVTCSADSLHFRVYAGVPTYLLGFIPLDDGQTLTLTHAGGFLESAGWTVADSASWLHEDPLLGVVGCIDRTQDVTVRVNTDGLTAGTYTAAITFTFTTCATKTITVPVTVDVIEPMVMGPLGIGADNELLKNILGDDTIQTANEYSGMILNLLTNPDDMMDMQAIQTDGSWTLEVQYSEVTLGSFMPFTGGTITFNGESQQIVGGGLSPISGLMVMMPPGMLDIPEDFDWGNNYVLMISTESNTYLGILLGEIGKLMDLLPALLPLLSTTAPAGTDLEGAPNLEGTDNGVVNTDPSEELTIPLKPILKLLPTLMPVLSNLLSNETVMALITPLLGLLPPIMIVLPLNVMQQLFFG